jgi:hypothetical protein
MKLITDTFNVSWDRFEDPGPAICGAGCRLPPGPWGIEEIDGWAIVQCTAEELEKIRQQELDIIESDVSPDEYEELGALFELVTGEVDFGELSGSLTRAKLAYELVNNLVIVVPMQWRVDRENIGCTDTCSTCKYKDNCCHRDIDAARKWIEEKMYAKNVA